MSLGVLGVLVPTMAYGGSPTAPDAFALVQQLQAGAWRKAQPLADCTQVPPEQQASCERFELAKPTDVLKDLQGSYTREMVNRLSLTQRPGSRRVSIRLRQQDQMATVQLARTYVTVTYPGATPDIPPATVKNPTRFFNALISPDLVNRYTVRVRVGYMTATKTCRDLSAPVTLPPFENYGALALDKSTIQIGDKAGPYTAKETTETFVTPHTSVARLTQRKPLTAFRKRRGSCVVVRQTSASRQPSRYGKLAERSTFVWGPFTRAKSSKRWPRTARLGAIK